MKVAVTLGDPAGVGPEIVLKSLLKLENHLSDIILIGNRQNFIRTSINLNLGNEAVRSVEMIDVGSEGFVTGKPQKESGYVALKSVETAVELCKSGETQGIATAPISKEAIRLAGSEYIDHTEMLSILTGSQNTVTLFQTRNLRVIFATKHLPLSMAIRKISKELLEEYIGLSDFSLRLLGFKRRRIAVAALNPHAGENGLIGSEEMDIIGPTVSSLSSRYDVSGPYPADSIFYRASVGEFDAVLSLYHDQGHIAAKMLDFHGTISMNLGLPFLRTSVDHGTAYDIAGKGIANENSMTSAIKFALENSEIYINNFAKLKGEP